MMTAAPSCENFSGVFDIDDDGACRRFESFESLEKLDRDLPALLESRISRMVLSEADDERCLIECSNCSTPTSTDSEVAAIAEKAEPLHLISLGAHSNDDVLSCMPKAPRSCAPHDVAAGRSLWTCCTNAPQRRQHRRAPIKRPEPPASPQSASPPTSVSPPSPPSRARKFARYAPDDDAGLTSGYGFFVPLD